MNIFRALMITLLLTGCSFQTNSKTAVKTTIPDQKPNYIIVQSKSSQSIGTVVEDMIVISDHLLQNEASLQPWNEQSFTIEARDFEHKIAYVSLPTPPFNTPSIKENNPLIGQNIYWIDTNQQSHQGYVQKVAVTDSSQDNPLITIRGNSGFIAKGSPLFDQKGSLMGIIIRANPTTKTLQAVRIQDVLQFIEENT